MLLLDLFLLRPTPYVHACTSPRAGLWIAGFLASSGALYGLLVATFQASSGALYGLLVATFQASAGGMIGGYPVSDIPAWVLYGGNILSGMVIAIVVHAGITIVAWLMARAVGGPGLLIGMYRTTAYLLPLGWPALPYVAHRSALVAGDTAAVAPSEWLLPLAGFGVALFLVGLVGAYRVTQETTPTRAFIGAVLFAAFSLAILLIA